MVHNFRCRTQAERILIDDLVVVWEFIRRDEITSADFGAVNLQFFRGNIQQTFDDEYSVLTSRSAIGRDDGLVGKDGSKLGIVISNVVGSSNVHCELSGTVSP